MYWPHNPALALAIAPAVAWRAPQRLVDRIRVVGCTLVLFSLIGMWLLDDWGHTLLNRLLHIGCITLVVLCHYHMYEVITE